VDWTGPGLCPKVGSGISSAKLLEYTIREFVSNVTEYSYSV
jgi:hypothetical protein